MNTYDLATDEGLRIASESIRDAEISTEKQQWIKDVAETIRWVRSADVNERASPEFQKRLWDKNRIANAGRGNISVDRALDDVEFRRFLAERSMASLPPSTKERVAFLTALFKDLVGQLERFLDRVPNVKIFRVFAALYPEVMTSIVSMDALAKLARAMGTDSNRDVPWVKAVERHVWIRHRLDSLFGVPPSDPASLAERMALPWLLYEQFVQTPPESRAENEDGISVPFENVEPPTTSAEMVLPEIHDVIAFIQARATFSETLIACLHAGIWAHPQRHFAILAGLSGSGKTLLARRYASALIQGGSDNQLLTLPVQPGWYDPGALLGYVNPLRNDCYIRTPFLEFLMLAAVHQERPYIVVLDEMNLSHPEQYMAPLLSAMETDEPIQIHAQGKSCEGVPREIPYPHNLILIGTVNMDETTHGLSDKVLDRAFVHEFWDVDLDTYPRWHTRGIDHAHEDQTLEILRLLMASLAPARLHFGWRVIDDMLDFLKQAGKSPGYLPFEVALDSVIYARILPKIRGEDTARLREALTGCENALKKYGLKRSAAKIVELRHDLESTGTARFWR